MKRRFFQTIIGPLQKGGRWWLGRALYIQILICIVLGIALGYLAGPKVGLIQPAGDIFIRLLKMLIVPLTFFTIVSGITRMEDLRSLRSIGGITILYYALTSLLAAAIGMGAALLLRPGRGARELSDMAAEQVAAPPEVDFVENIVSWVPTNPIEAMADNNMLQIIFFSLVVGVGLLALNGRGQDMVSLFRSGADLMITITGFVMKLAPYGILALVANMVASLDAAMLKEVGMFILTDIVGVAFVLLAVYPILLKTLGRVGPLRFYRNVSPAVMVAAGTTSSMATLPVSMGVAEKNLGAPEKLYGFTLPLGATVNMDGMAVAIGVIAVFACYLNGLPITPTRMIQIIFLGLVLSIGTAGIKSAGVVISAILLQTLGLPLDKLVAIFASIWPIIDIGHTTCNVTGDLCGMTIVGSRLNLLDRDIFEGKKPYAQNNRQTKGGPVHE